MKVSSEASSIIAGIKNKGKGAEEPAEEAEEEAGDTSAEAARAACEDMLKVLFKGREPTSEEADAFEEALDSYFTAKGY